MSARAQMTIRLLLAAAMIAGAFAAPQIASAAKFTFYYNHPDLDWYVIHTEHFRTYYPVSKVGPEENPYYIDGHDVARKCALINEEMYEPVCSQYDHFLEETVNVVMLEQADDLEGYTIPNFDWIVVSSRHDDMLWRWRGHGDWIRDVMYHEYAHVVSLKKNAVFAENGFGWLFDSRFRDGAYNIDTGLSLFIGDGDPWWWVEGGAEYTSEVAGINTWNSNRDMWMRADILEGTLLNKADWEDYAGRDSWMDGERHYNSGYNFAVYLEEQYGEGIYQAFATTRSENGWTANWDRVVEDTLGVTVEELRQGWIEWCRAKYEKQRDDVMAEPAIGGPLRYTVPVWEKPEDDEERIEWEKQLEFRRRADLEKTGYMRWFPRYSPDGRYYSDYEYRGRRLTIAEVDEDIWMPFRRAYLDDEEDEELIGDLGKRSQTTGWTKGSAAVVMGSGQFDWSPDGTRFVTRCSEHGVELSKAQYELKAYHPPGGYEWGCLCISEVYDQEDEEETAPGIRLLYKLPGTLRGSDPAWSPDGEWLAYTKFEDGNQVLYKIRADDQSARGDTKVVLTPWDDGTQIEMVDWSPDGTQLVFGAWRHEMQDLWLVNADGTDLHPITLDRYENREPYWADDGMIYFSSDRVGGIYNIFRFNPGAEIGWKDTDGDGFADSADACPEEAETFNRWRDRDGCPDELPVRITAERVEISEKIHFALDEATIMEDSFPLMDVISETIAAHGELLSIEVAGHTDAQGKKRYNQELSERRAAAVVEYLTSHGVDGGRLISEGYGQTRPLVDEDTEEAYAMNRRVEFVILERAEPPAKVAGDPQGEDAAEGDATAEAADEAVEGAFTAPELPDELPESLLIVQEYTPEIVAARATADELDNAALVQITNVVYGAFTPSITPKGNLLYSYYTAYGWKVYGLNKEDFYNHAVDDTALAIADEDWDLEPQEEYPSYEGQTEKVASGIRFQQPPGAIPILTFENSSRSHLGFSGGVYLFGGDFLSNHEWSIYTSFGEDMRVQGLVQINKLAPTIYLGGMYAAVKYDYAYRWDLDEDPATTDDVYQGDIKGQQAYFGGFGGINATINPYMSLGLENFTYGAQYVGTSEGTGSSPLFFHSRTALQWQLASFSERAMYWYNYTNPRGGVMVRAALALGYSDILYESTHGVDADDGQLFDKYWYPEIEFQTVGYIAVPWAKKYKHTLQVDLQLGMIPMNVPYWDEFRGGGSSALGWRNPWSTNSAFSGYEPWSLSGEYKGLVNAAYRLPVRQNIDKKFGVMYLESVWLQIFGTAGNFWSYGIREGAETYSYVYGDEVAYDPNDVVPEGPFSDRLDNCPTGRQLRNDGECGRALFPRASQNGNRMLFDIGVELRVQANIFNRSSWNSFIRVAYGFNEIGGIWDVDGDDIVTNVSDPNVGAISSEKEKPSIRLYVGLGTGW